MQIVTKNSEETLAFGKNLGKGLNPGDIVLLFGELGSGKTTLVQGIANGLGLKKGEYVRSPTFTIINEYRGRYPIYHIDLYRLQSSAEVENLGLEEVLLGKGVAVVEWADKLFPKTAENSISSWIDARLEIHITLGQDDQRFFDIQPINMKGIAALLFTLH